MTSWSEIFQRVKEKENLSEFSMRELCEAVGVEEVDENCLEKITKKLRENRIGHIPKVRPSSQDELIRLFMYDNSVGDLVQRTHPLASRAK